MASEQREVIRTLEMYERMFTLNKYSKQHKSVSMTCKDIRFLLEICWIHPQLFTTDVHMALVTKARECQSPTTAER